MVDADIDGELIANTGAAVGAINWGLMETADINIVTEAVGTGNAGIVYIALGAMGTVALTERFGITEFFEE